MILTRLLSLREQPGGPSEAQLREAAIELPLSLEDLREALDELSKTINAASVNMKELVSSLRNLEWPRYLAELKSDFPNRSLRKKRMRKKYARQANIQPALFRSW